MMLSRIVETVTEGIAQNRTLLDIFRDAYKAEEPEILLKMRAHTLSRLETLALQEGIEDEERAVVDAFIQIVSHPCLKETAQKASLTWWSKAHAVALKLLLKRYGEDGGVRIVAEIEEAIAGLREEAKDGQEAAFVKALEDAVDGFEVCYAIEGNRAYKHLVVQIVGIVMLYKESIKNASPDFRQRVKKIVEIIIHADKLVDALSHLKDVAIEGWRLLGM